MKDNPAGSNPSISNAPAAKQPATPFGPGQENPRVVLTSGQVLEIYASDARGIDLAARYGVRQNTISMIRKGRRWAWLTQTSQDAESVHHTPTNEKEARQ